MINSSKLRTKFAKSAFNKWKRLTKKLPEQSIARHPHGHIACSFSIVGPIKTLSNEEFLKILKETIFPYYPVGVLPSFIDQQTIECWFGKLWKIYQTEETYLYTRGNSTFWRASSKGLVYIQNSHFEDLHAEPGTFLDFNLLIRTLIMFIIGAHKLMKALSLDNTQAFVDLNLHYTGLSGRALVDWQHATPVFKKGVSNQNEFEISTVYNLIEPYNAEQIIEIITPLLNRFYENFNYIESIKKEVKRVFSLGNFNDFTEQAPLSPPDTKSIINYIKEFFHV